MQSNPYLWSYVAAFVTGAVLAILVVTAGNVFMVLTFGFENVLTFGVLGLVGIVGGAALALTAMYMDWRLGGW